MYEQRPEKVMIFEIFFESDKVKKKLFRQFEFILIF